MLRNPHYEAHVHDARHEASRSTAIAALWMLCDAWREALAAWRDYERLTSMGIPHATALREALGIGCGRSALEPVRPLCFAGRA